MDAAYVWEFSRPQNSLFLRVRKPSILGTSARLGDFTCRSHALPGAGAAVSPLAGAGCVESRAVIFVSLGESFQQKGKMWVKLKVINYTLQ